MKKLFLMLAIVAGTGAGAWGIFVLADRYLARSPVSLVAAPSVHCRSSGAVHRVTIRSGLVQPVRTEAALCDTLVITNTDNRYRLLAFGPHDDHQPYDGVSERMLGQNQSLSVSLVQRGTFLFHDHLEKTAAGSFAVR